MVNRRSSFTHGWKRHIVAMLAGAALGILAGILIADAIQGHTARSRDQRSMPAVATPAKIPATGR
jgi:hypothetical protein